MNIAQGTLREVLDPHSIEDDLTNISFGSTGGIHRARTVPGSEINKLFPDFLTVSVYPQLLGAHRDYRIVSVLELKRDDQSLTKSQEQMLQYMERILEVGNPSNNFRGFLLMGEFVEIYGSRGFAERRIPEYLGTFNIFDAADRFTNELAEIAVAHWNQQ